jgi:transposase
MSNLLNLNAAGIDISLKEHVVAVPEDRDKQSVRSFKTFSEDLHLLAKWLKSCNIETVAMESTGVYWYHLYTVLLDYGFTVDLVNAGHVKNVPGRKSDVSDARWLQQLHSFGLLRGCFQPDNLTRSLRNFVRQRKTIITDRTTQIQRMQKALEQMNIKLNNVIRDLDGKTGRTIIAKILEGERDPVILSQYADRRIKCTNNVLVKSLEGNWREEQLFNLRQASDHISFLEDQLTDCDREAEKIIRQFSSEEKDDLPTGGMRKSQPSFNVKQYLYEIHGVDVTQIYGFKSTTALTVFSETGPNIKCQFPSQKQFLSWLNVVPDNKITGGKVISSRVRKKKNRAGQSFRDAANALWNANNPLGEYLRYKKAKSGSRAAVVATARKIAAIYYRMIVDQEEFDPQKLVVKSKEQLARKLKKLQKSIERTELQLANL